MGQSRADMFLPISPFLWQRLSDAVEAVRQRLLTAARVLGKAGIHYAVIGDNAVAAWVATIDEASVRLDRCDGHEAGCLARQGPCPFAGHGIGRNH